MATNNYNSAGVTNVRPVPMKAGVSFKRGEIVEIDSSGYAVPGAAAADHRPSGVAFKDASNVGGANGENTVDVEFGGDWIAVLNSSGADAVLITDQDAPVYTYDANSVSRLSAGKSKLGIFKGFGAGGAVRVYINPS